MPKTSCPSFRWTGTCFHHMQTVETGVRRNIFELSCVKFCLYFVLNAQCKGNTVNGRDSGGFWWTNICSYFCSTTGNLTFVGFPRYLLQGMLQKVPSIPVLLPPYYPYSNCPYMSGMFPQSSAELSPYRISSCFPYRDWLTLIRRSPCVGPVLQWIREFCWCLPPTLRSGSHAVKRQNHTTSFLVLLHRK